MKHHHDARLCASTFCSLYDGIDKRLRNIEQHWRKFNHHRYQWCSFSCYSSRHVLHGVVEYGWTLKIKRSTPPRSIKDWPLYNIRRCLQRMHFALAHNMYWLWWYCMRYRHRIYRSVIKYQVNRNELTIVHWLAYNSHRSLQRMHRCFVYHNFCMYRQDTIYNTIIIYFKFILSWNAYDFRPFHNDRPIIFVVY